MPSTLPLTAGSLIITTLIVRLMPPATISKVVCIFVVVLALSAIGASYLTTTQEPRKETKAEKKKRKKENQKAMMKQLFPKKVEMLGRRKAPKVEVVEGGVGRHPVSPVGEEEVQT